MAERDSVTLELDGREVKFSNLLDLAARGEAEGLGDAPWPPHFRMQKGEAKRVQPSRARKE
jgi:bifunctional non-homologous end joining protein LigD